MLRVRRVWVVFRFPYIVIISLEKVTFSCEKVTFSREKVTFRNEKVTFSDEKVVFSNEKVTLFCLKRCFFLLSVWLFKIKSVPLHLRLRPSPDYFTPRERPIFIAVRYERVG